MKHKIIIYGLGAKGYRLLKQTKGILECIDIVALSDKNFSEYKKIYPDQMVIDNKDIVELDYDYILVTSTRYYSDVKQDLLKLNVPDEKISEVTKYFFDIFSKNISYTFEGNGIDIGGPSALFEEIYKRASSMDIVNYSMHNTWGHLERTFLFEGEKKGKVVENDATMLIDIEDDVYDFVLSSNNLEHIANPIKAIAEWVRILKKNGIVIIIVPAKEYCFDHNRQVVAFEHLLEDYNNNIGEDDLSHLDEILLLHDLEMDKPAGTKEQFRERSCNNYANRCLHQHVFDENVLSSIANFFDLEILLSGIIYENCHVIVMKK